MRKRSDFCPQRSFGTLSRAPTLSWLQTRKRLSQPALAAGRRCFGANGTAEGANKADISASGAGCGCAGGRARRGSSARCLNTNPAPSFAGAENEVCPQGSGLAYGSPPPPKKEQGRGKEAESAEQRHRDAKEPGQCPGRGQQQSGIHKKVWSKSDLGMPGRGGRPCQSPLHGAAHGRGSRRAQSVGHY